MNGKLTGGIGMLLRKNRTLTFENWHLIISKLLKLRRRNSKFSF